ncbi:MAG: IS200/IS605 family transposase [Promethearchaeota archaeon]
MGVSYQAITKNSWHDKLKYRKEAHKVYSLHYHLVFVVKYRQNVFVEDHEIINFMKSMFEEISEEHWVKIEEMEYEVDHIHILISTKPTLSMPRYINTLKGRSSRYLRKIFHDFLKYKLWGDHFWTPSYFTATTGNMSIDVLKYYIETQKRRNN